MVRNPLPPARAGSVYTYQPSATDEDLPANTLTFTAERLPVWLSFDPVTHTLSGTPSAEETGVFEVRLKLSDGQAEAEQAFELLVEGPTGLHPEGRLTEETVRLAPNPTKGVIAIQYPQQVKGSIFQAVLLSLEGQKLVSLRGTLPEVNEAVSSYLLQAGERMYVLQLSLGKETLHLKIVKQ
nr:putative Ig domain-containing protein [Cesiribacter sp. SM1]